MRALPERAAFRIEFPNVEGYVFALQRNAVDADIGHMEPLTLEPGQAPTATFVKPQVGYQVGNPGLGGGFDFAEQTRDAFYASTHRQTIEFEIARLVVTALTSGIPGVQVKAAWKRLLARHDLFPQVFRLVRDYVSRKVDFNGCHECELGLETYVRRIVERMLDAIEPDAGEGEPPLLPRLARHRPRGSTDDVNFRTTKPVVQTARSHVNLAVKDNRTWEGKAVFALEQARHAVAFYARNEGLELAVPYDYQGVQHLYFPDFVVRMTDGSALLLEIKGWEDDQDRAKHQAAKRWVSAVNNWGQLGRWDFAVCRNPDQLGVQLNALLEQGRGDCGSNSLPGVSASIQDGCGIVNSGIGDLASNPRHLEGFGRD